MNFKIYAITILLVSGLSVLGTGKVNPESRGYTVDSLGFTDAGTFGFSPDLNGIENAKALQKALDMGGTIVVSDYYKTNIHIHGCIFEQKGEMILIENTAKGKKNDLKTSSNTETGENFSAKINTVGGIIQVESDLTGLKK